MGIIIRQSAKASISSYLGAVLGFVNVALLMNQLFSPDEFGLRSILIDVAVVSSMIAQLGTARTIVKLYPFFSHQSKHDNGLFSFSLLFSFFGFLLIAILLAFFKDPVVDHFEGNSSLIGDYYWVIFPLSFFMLLNLMFESNLQAMSRTAFSAFLRHVVSRVMITILLGLYYLKYIDFYGFILLFVSSYAINVLLFLIYLKVNNQLYFKINLSFYRKSLRKIYLRYSLFSIWTNIAIRVTSKLDAMMILYFLGLSAVAVYSNAIYLVMLVTIPSASIAKISFPILSKQWKNKRIDLIEELYKKSSLNQFLLGGTLFILLWVNLDNVFSLQREIYANGKYIVLIIGLSQIFNMLTGINSQIINASKYYPFLSIASSVLIVVVILTNYWLIPIYGVIGAAFATSVSIVFYNTARLLFIYAKIGIHPFSSKLMVVFASFIIILIVNYLIQGFDNVFLDTIVRSIIILIGMSIATLNFNLSTELNSIIKKYLRIKK